MNLTFDWLLWTDRAGMWLATYFLHSTVLLVSALLLSRTMRARRLALQESVLKVALIGGLLTASLQVGFGWQAATGSLPYPSRSAEQRSHHSAADGGAVVGGPALDARADPGNDPATASAAPIAEVHEQGTSEAASPVGTTKLLVSEIPWSALAVGLWSLLALLLTMRLLVAARRLGRTLRTRVEVRDGRLFRLFWRLLAAADVDRPTRLTRTDRLQVPVALGLWGREICLPTRVADGLPQEEQETVLAHELAHLERRDPLWLVGGLLLESVLFLQPLNRLARTRLQEIAEFRCDDYAARLTGRPLTLARCLTEVATWSSIRLEVLAPTMAGRPSGLGRRVRRLLEPGYTGTAARTPGWWLPVAAAALTLVLVAVPGFSVVGEGSEPQEPVEAAGEMEPQKAAESAKPAMAEIGEDVPEAPLTVSEPAPVKVPEPVREISSRVLTRERVVVEPVIAVRAPRAVDVRSRVRTRVLVAPEVPRAEPVLVVQTVPRDIVELAPRIQSRVAMVMESPLEDADSQDRASEHDGRHDEDWDDDWNGDEDWEDDLDELEDQLDEIMDEMDEVFEEEIEVAIEALEDEMDSIEDEMDEIFETEFESFEEELEVQFELFEQDLERLEDSVEERLDRRDSERLEERFENDLERIEDSVDRLEDRVDEKLDRIEERFERSMESRFDHQMEHDLERQLEKMGHRMESESHRLEELAHDLAMQAHERGEHGLSADERQQLLDEAHRLAATAGPTPEELESIRSELERFRSQIRPDVQEMESTRREMRLQLEQLAGELAEGLEEERRSLEELRRKYEG